VTRPAEPDNLHPLPAAPNGSKPVGIVCPKCGGRRLVTDYTRYRAGAIVRVRRCLEPACGHRVRTIERVESAAAASMPQCAPHHHWRRRKARRPE
jgi:transcriptional regulator NrdR family protein